MNDRKLIIEIFTASCPVCDGVIADIRAASCPSCDIEVLDMNDPDVMRRAAALEIVSVPAVVIDGNLADCCVARGVDMDVLLTAGLGQALR